MCYWSLQKMKCLPFVAGKVECHGFVLNTVSRNLIGQCPCQLNTFFNIGCQTLTSWQARKVEECCVQLCTNVLQHRHTCIIITCICKCTTLPDGTLHK